MTARAEMENARVEAELAQQKAQQEIDAEKQKGEQQALEAALGRERLKHDAAINRLKIDIAVEGERRAMLDTISDARLQEILVTSLPTLIEKLPKHTKSEVITIGDGAAGDGVGQLFALIKTLKSALAKDTAPTT